ncbi:transcriptional regulator [Clostridium pasteurianum]|uniref:MarR family winged helix-turn-helix transcriptional regulator n=1 Tax=Clostridium pasteurianum TaxID=1501 RepID=UPI002260EAFF|nr:MarR family transcriptional regulator [Clostridium pasteurianum]UZW14928.1 transcriptional regulator [Clostridium pasteurianum]
MELLDDVLINLQCELVAERNIVNPKEITWLQYDILHILSENKWILPSELNLSLGISRSKLSKALKELKIMGYIQQKTSEKDGRELLTSLTNEGQKLLRSVKSGHNKIYSIAKEIFTQEEQKQFEKLASKLSEALRDERMSANE